MATELGDEEIEAKAIEEMKTPRTPRGGKEGISISHNAHGKRTGNKNSESRHFPSPFFQGGDREGVGIE
jgi:hypothetical protein